MTVNADECFVLIDRRQFLTHVLAQAVFVMTLGARGDWNIRFQATETRRLGDIDVASRALRNVDLLFSTAFVNKLQ